MILTKHYKFYELFMSQFNLNVHTTVILYTYIYIPIV